MQEPESAWIQAHIPPVLSFLLMRWKMLKWLEVKFIFCRSLFLLGFLSYLHTNPVNAFLFSSRLICMRTWFSPLDVARQAGTWISSRMQVVFLGNRIETAQNISFWKLMILLSSMSCSRDKRETTFLVELWHFYEQVHKISFLCQMMHSIITPPSTVFSVKANSFAMPIPMLAFEKFWETTNSALIALIFRAII